jgi:hypothetical protein
VTPASLPHALSTGPKVIFFEKTILLSGLFIYNDLYEKHFSENLQYPPDFTSDSRDSGAGVSGDPDRRKRVGRCGTTYVGDRKKGSPLIIRENTGR